MSRKNREPMESPPTGVAPQEQPASERAGENSGAPIVGIGASAGGLDAISELLEELPPAPGLALVVVQHLQPTHSSDLAAILGRKTSMPVVQVEQGMAVEPDHVYVIPPNVQMRMSGDVFALSPRPSGATPSLTVDMFLTSLAEQHGNRAIGVILSGSASDGTKGLAAIKAEDGITFVQDPESAAHKGMPESAIAAGVADAVLPIKEIARELVRLAEHPYIRRDEPSDAEGPPPLSKDDESALAEILARVRQSTGLDLSHYKRPTLLRRIGRRMAMKRAASMADYASLIGSEPEEAAELVADVLVRVTSFFRDPEVFEALKAEAFPSIVQSKSGDTAVRIWVPGCATGQEAYSIAMVLLEYLEASGSSAQVQIFASDLRENDLAFARRGVFPFEIAAEVTDERLARFFTQVEDGYQVNKTIRETCVFARHDVTKDPPFARLDLVSCRNLLIYLDGTLQRRLLGILHYALVPDGILMLGNSESAGAAPGLFRRTKGKGILVRLPGESHPLTFGDYSRDATRFRAEPPADASVKAERDREWSDAQRQLDAMLLDKYAPAALLVDENLKIRQIRGDAGKYLELRAGEATLDLAGMVSVGFASAVTSAIGEARDTGRPAHREAVSPQAGGGHIAVEILVIPVVTADLPLSYAVLFNEGAVVSRAGGEPGTEPTETQYLRQELEAASERLRILREGRDAAHESLQAANEEIQSSNEELQSMNEELETAKEELQSTNEELTTLNDELQARNVELAQRNDDLNNLLVSASIAMLVLDAELNIRRFTAQAAQTFNLIPGDIGRRITDIRWRLVVDDVGELLDSVVSSGQPLEREVVDDSGCWYRMTVKPYVTGRGGVAGAVVTLLDIDSLRRSQIALERAGALSEAVNRVSAALEPVDGTPSATCDALGVIGEVLGAGRTQLVSWQADAWTLTAESSPDGHSEQPRALSPLEAEQLGLSVDIQTERTPIEEPSTDGSRRLTIPLSSSGGTFLGVMRVELDDERPRLDAAERDFSSRAAAIIAIFLERERSAEVLDSLVGERTVALEEALRRLETANHVKNMFLANMSHELRTPLNSIIGFSTVLLQGMAGDLNDEQRRQLEMVQSSGKHLLAIVSDLLDIEKITAGAMPVTVAEFRLADVVRTVGELERPVAESKGIELRMPAEHSDIVLVSDELKTRQILLNLVSNAVKFTKAGHVNVSASATEDMCFIVVQDTGRGMAPEQLEQAFEEFQQMDYDPDRLKDGAGLGLSIAARLAHLLGGELTAESTLGVGSTFTVALALRVRPTDSSVAAV
jgi:two-component system, chemotaxis family, CheB/CheR fusion protein